MRYRPFARHVTPRSRGGWRLKLQQASDAQRRAIVERDRALVQASQARAEVERLTGVVEEMASRVQYLLNAASQQTFRAASSSTAASSPAQTLLAVANREIAMQSAVIEGLVGRVRTLMQAAGIEVVMGADGWRYRILRLRDAWDGPFDTAEQALSAAAELLLARAGEGEVEG